MSLLMRSHAQRAESLELRRSKPLVLTKDCQDTRRICLLEVTLRMVVYFSCNDKANSDIFIHQQCWVEAGILPSSRYRNSTLEQVTFATG